ncbi:MAG: pitrilysin family protein [Armatimonadota bacterium]|nr:pitrilysin family protein [Armatimonadota bacterium]
MSKCAPRRWPGGLAAVLLALLLPLPAAAQSRPSRVVLRNGITVIIKEVHSSHVLAVNVFIRGGASLDPADLPGLANFTHQVMARGTIRRTGEQLSAPIEAVGGTLQARTEQEYSLFLSLSPADALDTVLDVLADLLLHPRFDAAEVEKERTELLQALAVLDEDPVWVVQRSLSERLYPMGPYGRAVPGSVDSVKRITRQQMIDFYRRHYGAENVVVVVVGNVDTEPTLRGVERAFAEARPSGRSAFRPTPVPYTPPAVPVVVKERGTQLAHLAVGFPMAGISREEYPVAMVMNALLGGGMGCRLRQALRERYDVGSFYAPYAGASYLGAYLRTPPIQLVGPGGAFGTEMVVEKEKTALLDQFEWLARNPIPEKEVSRARNFAIGAFTREHQRTLNQARYLGSFELAGLGCQYDDELPQAMAKVTADDLGRLARKYFTRYALALVMPRPE